MAVRWSEKRSQQGARIRITCRDDSDLTRVEEVAEETEAVSSQVLSDRW